MQDWKQPDSAAELAGQLASAAAAGQRIAVGGNHTKSRWAGPAGPADVRLSTARLNRVLEYEPRDLTISVEAGMPYAELSALLAKNRQMIPLDPPYASSATIGGVLAANQAGPRRRLFGTGRDLVIGMQFATLEGKLVQSGGMVVKNVAGLDIAKLMIGSWGTLAAITVVNFKLIPIDKATRTFLQTFPSAADALAERNRILQSVLQPAAVDLLNPVASARIGRSGWILAIGTGGSPALIDRYSREFAKAEALDGDAERAFWSAVESFPETFLAQHPAGGIVRAATPLQEMTSVLAAHTGPAIARAGNGISYLYHDSLAGAPAAPEGAWPTAGPQLLVEAGPDTRDAASLWPAPDSGFPVMQNIKQMFDPRHLLNKGRLYGRI